MKDQEPSKKFVNQQMLEQENMEMDQVKQKVKKNGWGKPANN